MCKYYLQFYYQFNPKRIHIQNLSALLLRRWTVLTVGVIRARSIETVIATIKLVFVASESRSYVVCKTGDDVFLGIIYL